MYRAKGSARRHKHISTEQLSNVSDLCQMCQVCADTSILKPLAQIGQIFFEQNKNFERFPEETSPQHVSEPARIRRPQTQAHDTPKRKSIAKNSKICGELYLGKIIFPLSGRATCTVELRGIWNVSVVPPFVRFWKVKRLGHVGAIAVPLFFPLVSLTAECIASPIVIIAPSRLVLFRIFIIDRAIDNIIVSTIES